MKDLGIAEAMKPKSKPAQGGRYMTLETIVMIPRSTSWR